MINELLLGLFTNLLYDIIKSGTKISAEELLKNTNYSYNECQYIADSIGYCNTNDKDELRKIINNTDIIEKINRDYYKTNFSIRLDYIVNLLRKHIPSVNIEWLCDKLGYDSSNKLLNYYRIPKEPSFNFIDEFSKEIGIKSNWLKYGVDENPFDTIHLGINRELLSYIKDNNIDSIIFAFSKNSLSQYNNSELIIIFKFNDLKYIINTKYIPFGSFVGGGGTNQICELFVFILWLKKEGLLDICKSYSISEEMHNNLLMGKEYGKAVEKCNNSLGNLIEDFINLNTFPPTEEQKLDFYGKSFIDCQQIIRENVDSVDKIKNDLLTK